MAVLKLTRALQGVFTAVADNKDNLNIVIRKKSECPEIF